VIFCV